MAINYYGTNGNDVVFGSSDNDTLRGLDGDDKLFGGDGNDFLDGGFGFDTINGGAGTDTTSYAFFSGPIDANLSTGVVKFPGNSTLTDTLVSIENLIGTAGNDTIVGNDANNVLSGAAGNDFIDGGFGFDTINGGAGTDTTSYAFFSGPIDANLSTSVVKFPGNSTLTDKLVSIENLIGTAGNDTIVGNDANNVLSGGAGNDFIDGGFGFDTIDGGTGTDTTSYAFFSGPIDANLSTGVVSFPGNSPLTDTLVSIENLIGTAGNDTIVGSSANNVLSGGDGDDSILGDFGNDKLFGGDGNDFLDGGFGFDTIDGGTGTDTTSYAFFSGPIDANLSTGVVSFPGNSPLTDTLVSIENLIGTAGNDTIVGNDANNVLSGAAGNDFIDGGFGFDTINGGAGTDTTSYAFFSGPIDANLSTGVVKFPGNSTLTDKLVSIENLIGTAGNDTIVGNDANNVLSGAAGNDFIDGGFGFDTIDGGTGTDTTSYAFFSGPIDANLSTGVVKFPGNSTLTDTLVSIENLIGTTGNDTIVGNDANNVLSGAAGNDFIDGGFGFDTINGGAGTDTTSYAFFSGPIDANLSTGVVKFPGNSTLTDKLVSIENLIGTAGNDTIVGNDANNVLSGAAGNDFIDGGFGFDTINGGAGTDTTSYAFFSGPIDANLSTGVVKFPGNSTLTDKLVSIENLIGTAGNDTIVGNDANNVLSGAAGNDFIDGGFGFDTIDGGTGTDTTSYAFFSGPIDANLSTGVVKFPGNSTLTDTLVSIENLIGTTGNDTIVGNDANNVLSGAAGNDFIDGGFGFDTINGGAGTDTTSYAFFSGPIDANLSTGVVKFPGNSTLTDKLVSIENLIGTAGNDTIVGNDANNVLSGAAGNDFIDGGFGFDTIDGGAGTDTTSYAFFSGPIDANLSTGVVKFPGNSTLTDKLVSIENLIGTTGNDTIVGSSANNVLNGEAGSDTLVGGYGTDVLTGGAGADKFVFNSKFEGIDIIKDFEWREGDKIQISKSGFGANSNNQFSYNSTNGNLFFAGFQFATIENKPSFFSVNLDVVLV